jgi:hypothetical protein
MVQPKSSRSQVAFIRSEVEHFRAKPTPVLNWRLAAMARKRGELTVNIEGLKNSYWLAYAHWILGRWQSRQSWTGATYQFAAEAGRGASELEDWASLRAVHPAGHVRANYDERQSPSHCQRPHNFAMLSASAAGPRRFRVDTRPARGIYFQFPMRNLSLAPVGGANRSSQSSPALECSSQ